MIRDPLDLPDYQVHRACKVCRVLLAMQVRWVLPENGVNAAKLARLVCVGRRDREDLKACLDRKASRVIVALEGIEAPRATGA